MLCKSIKRVNRSSAVACSSERGPSRQRVQQPKPGHLLRYFVLAFGLLSAAAAYNSSPSTILLPLLAQHSYKPKQRPATAGTCS